MNNKDPLARAGHSSNWTPYNAGGHTPVQCGPACFVRWTGAPRRICRALHRLIPVSNVFPFQSEVVLFGMLIAGHYTWWALVLVASAGNTLGSVRTASRRLRGPPLVSGLAREDRQGGTLVPPLRPLVSPAILGSDHRRSAHHHSRRAARAASGFVLLVAVAKTARYFAVAALSFGWM